MAKEYVPAEIEVLVPVVRCKECKHRNRTWDGRYECAFDTGDPYALGRDAHDDNWFCADGERSENERTD